MESNSLLDQKIGSKTTSELADRAALRSPDASFSYSSSSSSSTLSCDVESISLTTSS
jgi:hypothetical protein